MNSPTFPPSLLLLVFTLNNPYLLKFFKKLLFFPLSFVLTQEGRSSSSLLGQIAPSFSTHPRFLLLPYQVQHQFFQPLLPFAFEGNYSQSPPLNSRHHLLVMLPPPSTQLCWLVGCTLKVHLFIMQQPSQLTLTPHDMSTPYQPRFHILIITPHSLPPLHTILIIFELEWTINNAFFPFQLQEEIIIDVLT